MGRSTPTVRQSTNSIVEKYERMKSCMRSSDIPFFEELIKMGRKHSPEISEAGIDPEIGFLISALIEILKQPRADQ
ncbi:MAG: hypothetical protein M1162_04760 [Candidatus Thermoplasmatota archaeon]|nr:hypothetical protein [Candidatus Thermoplasmatota archaeon]